MCCDRCLVVTRTVTFSDLVELMVKEGRHCRGSQTSGHIMLSCAKEYNRLVLPPLKENKGVTVKERRVRRARLPIRPLGLLSAGGPVRTWPCPFASFVFLGCQP